MNILLPMLILIIIISGRYRIKGIERVFNDVTMRKIKLCLVFFVLFFFATFRYNVGYDYCRYYAYFYNMKGAYYFEYIPKLIYKIAQATNQVWVLFSLFAGLILFFFYKGIEMQKQLDYYEASIVFICLFYLDSLTIMRQMVAVAFVFWGYKYIFEKKFWKFLIIVAIASLAHPTALIALAIYFIYNYVDYKKSIPLVVIISFIGGIGFNFITQYKLFSRFVIYLNERTSDGGSSVRVFYIILFVVCFISIINLGMGDEMSKKLLSVAMFGIAFPFVLGPQQGLRMALYFNVSYIFLIPQILAKVSIKNKYICMVPFYLFYITFLLIDMKNNSGYSPYTFIFMQE